MNRLDPIADQLRRTLAGPMWHGDAVHAILQNVSARDAAEHPVTGAHSIWELVLHMTAWADIARERLSLAELPEPTTAQDWPPAPANQSTTAWRDAQQRLTEAYEKLAVITAILDARTLETTVPGHSYPVHEMLTGVVEHAVYHGGQIALLKRALLERA